ncbi:MAG: glyoxylate/hydroxypyruvate reductase A [Sulfitobacter sp.]
MQLPNLKWVQSLWAGVENLVQTLPNDIDIVRMVDPNLAKTMAEAALTMTLFLHRNLPSYADHQAASIWQQHPVHLPQDRNIGILGLGELGRAAGAKLTQNGFNVLGWSRSPKSIANIQCHSGKEGLINLLGTSDIVVVLLPLTAETNGLLDKKRLLQIKPGASIINLGRAQIIEIDAMLGMLNAGHLKHVVLDVFETEPLPTCDPLWTTANLTILPHVSAPTNMETASEIVAGNINSYYKTGQIPLSVSREKGY